MMIKLDSGDYINTAFVTCINVKQLLKFAAHGKLEKLRDDGFRVHMANDPEKCFDITEADRDRIVEAMGGQPMRTDADLPEPYAWETKEGELRYDQWSVADYNVTYHNSIGIEDSLYTVDQMRAALGIGGYQIEGEAHD